MFSLAYFVFGRELHNKVSRCSASRPVIILNNYGTMPGSFWVMWCLAWLSVRV